MRRPPILAVDGGGSKVDAALLTRGGDVIGAARIPDPRWEDTGDELHMESIAAALEAAACDAELDPASRPIADLGVYCLAGADLPADHRRILRGLGRRGFTGTDVLRNDTFAVLRAGTERDWGVGVVCGFGTNCSGVAPSGRQYRLPAIGRISGDWGGAVEIGEAALWHAVRARDGRGPATTLATSVPAAFGVRTPRQVMERLYFRRMDDARLAELAPVVFHDAAGGDPVARALVDRQADEIVLMAGAAIRRLGMRASDVEVVLGGGIFRNRFAPFFGRIETGLRAVAEQARIVVLEAPPLVGAAMLALDRIGATKRAKARVRAALTHERLSAGARTAATEA
ncbi:MAG TPA: BadF/BadG/BcrA/BcrD ATPase family protein [Actinomycetota bacterium]|nr:BadF/BadG/BcrA/BcrD ATPase family protein [Actinomycetota bacterium]